MSEHRKSFRIKISHDSFGECLGQTRNLSATGVYVKHPGLSSLPKGAVVYGQVQVEVMEDGLVVKPSLTHISKKGNP